MAPGCGDSGGIFGLVKFLDPGSRVTGSEVELGQGASPFAQQALVIWNQVKGISGLMTPDMRAQMTELVAANMGLIEGQMIRNNAYFNEQIGKVMSGQFLPGLEQALGVSQSPFFNPDFALPEFAPGGKGRGIGTPSGNKRGSAATPGGATEFDLT